MSEIRADIERRKERIQKSIAPAIDNGILIFPVSHNKLMARWSMSQNVLDTGLLTASRTREEARLVLRVYSLPLEGDPRDFSNIWNDYSIDETVNNAYFTLPKSAARIRAVIGVINKSGHFSPLLRGDPIPLPAPPPAPPPNKKLCPAVKPFNASGN